MKSAGNNRRIASGITLIAISRYWIDRRERRPEAWLVSRGERISKGKEVGRLCCSGRRCGWSCEQRETDNETKYDPHPSRSNAKTGNHVGSCISSVVREVRDIGADSVLEEHSARSERLSIERRRNSKYNTIDLRTIVRRCSDQPKGVTLNFEWLAFLLLRIVGRVLDNFCSDDSSQGSVAEGELTGRALGIPLRFIWLGLSQPCMHLVNTIKLRQNLPRLCHSARSHLRSARSEHQSFGFCSEIKVYSDNLISR